MTGTLKYKNQPTKKKIRDIQNVGSTVSFFHFLSMTSYIFVGEHLLVIFEEVSDMAGIKNPQKGIQKGRKIGEKATVGNRSKIKHGFYFTVVS
jgi:hypothetical protein